MGDLLPAAAAQLHRAPRIRSERPAFELHYPEYIERFRNEAHVGGKASPYEVAAHTAGPETHGADDPRSR